MSKREIAQTVKDFTHTAVLAKEAGYDGVEIMGSEGYLLSQFLSPSTNRRTDEYGGSFQNRARFPLDIVQSVRQATGQDFVIIFRISLLDLVQGGGTTWEETLELAASLEQAGVSILNTGIGWHEVRQLGIGYCKCWRRPHPSSPTVLVLNIIPPVSSSDDCHVGTPWCVYLLHQTAQGGERCPHSTGLHQSD